MNRRGFIGSLLALPLVNKLPVTKEPVLAIAQKEPSFTTTRTWRNARSTAMTTSSPVNTLYVDWCNGVRTRDEKS